MVVQFHGTVMKTGEVDCPYCGRGFWVARDLELHIRNDHRMGTAFFNQDSG